jgi:hypothetical protein
LIKASKVKQNLGKPIKIAINFELIEQPGENFNCKYIKPQHTKHSKLKPWVGFV